MSRRAPAKFLEHSWKPGQSGNPAGRPKRMSFEAIVAEVLDEAIPGSDASKREALARIFVDEMLKRNGSMIREFMAREWPVIHKHEVETYGGVEIDALEAEIRAVVGAGPHEPAVNGITNSGNGRAV